ncbi:MAG: HAMP domain-containing histidine kinase [Planctomycetes bacterium]|nr:HAMP domain-containing histidine kinase [Planctomycetota bacterium]
MRWPKRYFAGRVQRREGFGKGSVFVLYPERSWALARWQAMSPPLAIGGVLLLPTVIASVWIAKRIGGRIQTVGQQVSRIAGGDFTPVGVTSVNDELRDLAEGVNRMAVALDESMRSIRERERSALLTQLVGGLAHQLRNALTGARTSIQLHRRHCGSRDDEAIDVALRQLTLTEEQIKALLRLTRGESRPSSSASVSTILDETISLVRPVCAHKKIRFFYERGDVEWHVSDSDAMRGALLNLMMNAIEAAGPLGVVRVGSSREASSVVIEVADNGPGVPMEIADDVFDPFFTTKDEGVGLGLALARKAAQDCDGTLSLHRSNGMTVFRLALRAEAVQGASGIESAEQIACPERRTARKGRGS